MTTDVLAGMAPALAPEVVESAVRRASTDLRTSALSAERELLLSVERQVEHNRREQTLAEQRFRAFAHTLSADARADCERQLAKGSEQVTEQVAELNQLRVEIQDAEEAKAARDSWLAELDLDYPFNSLLLLPCDPGRTHHHLIEGRAPRESCNHRSRRSRATSSSSSRGDPDEPPGSRRARLAAGRSPLSGRGQR
jgi:hypothetical protein